MWSSVFYLRMGLRWTVKRRWRCLGDSTFYNSAGLGRKERENKGQRSILDLFIVPHPGSSAFLPQTTGHLGPGWFLEYMCKDGELQENGGHSYLLFCSLHFLLCNCKLEHAVSTSSLSAGAESTHCHFIAFRLVPQSPVKEAKQIFLLLSLSLPLVQAYSRYPISAVDQQLRGFPSPFPFGLSSCWKHWYFCVWAKHDEREHFLLNGPGILPLLFI